jgi:two-component system chemotaxis response regulator CheY
VQAKKYILVLTKNELQFMRSVLIIDDAGFDRTIIGALLTQSGFNVIGEAENGKEGIKMALELVPDIITLDKMMPDMDGMEVLKELSTKNINSKIVLISGDDLSSIKNEAQALGAKDFLKKPISKSDLKEKLEGLFI